MLKAIAKNPAERYATAQELADDFARFLEDKPIRAHRPTLVQRLRRRLRRHRAVVLAAGVCAAAMLLLAVILLAVSNVRIAAEQAQTRQALAAAEHERARAEANFAKARDAVDQMLTEIAEQRLADVPQLQPVRRAVLEKALHFYQGFLEEKGDDPKVRLETGRAYCRVGNIYNWLGQPGPSEKALRQGLELFDKLLAQFPDEPTYCQEAALACAALGNSLREQLRRTRRSRTLPAPGARSVASAGYAFSREAPGSAGRGLARTGLSALGRRPAVRGGALLSAGPDRFSKHQERPGWPCDES